MTVFFAGLTALVCLGCVIMSLRRLACAVAPTCLDPELLRQAIQRDPSGALIRLRDVTAASPALAWEHGLLTALAEPSAAMRDAMVREQMTEFEALADRWARAPRVCASISTTSGFLFASVIVLGTASAPWADDAQASLHEGLVAAVDALAIGIAGMSFCVAIQVRARSAIRKTRSGLRRLMDRLQMVAEERESPECA